MGGNGPFLAEKPNFPNFEKAIQNQIQGRGADDRASPRTGCDPRARAHGVQNRRTRAVKKRGSTGAHVPFRRGDYPGSPGYRSTPVQNVTRRPSVDDFNIDVLFFREP